ncbi:SpoIIE family protein phosphatase [Dehalobacter sp. DCM]|uniref:SpoIIE family protein phosphatase n=1 Tax=Dehalobacter sp. DCM TaxID=2907827 RepID=UPI003081599B|nr:SpoIIE family protein phosphatase [Dehalobacter sp. DCM]
MAEWATLKAEKVIRRLYDSIGIYLIIAFIGLLAARANIQGIYPFAAAFLIVLALEKNKWILPGLVGVMIGLVTLKNGTLCLEVIPGIILGVIVARRLVVGKAKLLLLALLTAVITVLPSLSMLAISHTLSADGIIILAARSALAAGFSIIFYFAFQYSECLWKGNFSSEQGLVWILVLAICLSGLQGLVIGKIDLQIVFLSFFLLYIAYNHGAGSAAGAGAILGFLLKWDIGADNLIDAGIYTLIGFICGGFTRFGKIGISLAFGASVLMLSFFDNEGFLSYHLYSSAVGLILFFFLPARKNDKSFLKKKVMPEIETTVSKVKTLGEIFDQLAFGFQAAGLESKLQPEIPELMNLLVERICKNCPNTEQCWEREFHRTYNFIYDVFAYSEETLFVDRLDPKAGQDSERARPAEWKRYCSRIDEVLLAVRFILEQEKDKEVWQKRLALNREALAGQYRGVSQVIGHLAQELHSKHNAEEGKPLVWSRKHKLILDLGVGTFIKSGNGISGDNFNSISLSSTKSALIVCDGMGAGEEAARMSSAALTILEQLLSTGFDPEGAIKALNAILVLRSPEESFVTIDMAVLDLEAETARLIKIGAAPSFVMKQDSVESVETSSLPAGILNDIDIPVIDIEFKDETLVIVTDGILDVAKDKPFWLKDFLAENKNCSSQELADKIVHKVLKMYGNYVEDDGVVLVIKRKDLGKR